MTMTSQRENPGEQAAAGQAFGQAAGRMVVGVDDSPGGLAALRLAARLARTGGVPLVAVRAWSLGLPRHGGRRHRPRGRGHPHVILYFDDAEECRESGEIVRKTFQAVIGGLPQDTAVSIETPEGDPGPALTQIAAAEGDILVVGRERGEAMRHLVHGSVSEYCSQHARCPVLLVQPAAGTQP